MRKCKKRKKVLRSIINTKKRRAIRVKKLAKRKENSETSHSLARKKNITY